MKSLTEIGLSTRTLIMGVLNVTPDSFSDGGDYLDPVSALRRAIEMVEEGADIIDVGGESTRPATFDDGMPLDIVEELRRVLPVVKLISKELPDQQISIDTYKSQVAWQAVEAGATIINDISGLTFDSDMAKTAADSACPVVLMHILGTPRKVATPQYSDVVGDISTFFEKQTGYAIDSGVRRCDIILDPGIGFGKTKEHNLTIIRELARFKALGFPILVGPSRKAFIGKILGDAPADDRLAGTSAAVALSIAGGADIVRVHDVREIARVAKVADAIVRG